MASFETAAVLSELVEKINNLALKGKVCWYKKSIKRGCCAQNFVLALKSKAFVDPKKGNQSSL